MKIEYTEGCTCYGITIDGKRFQDMTEEEIYKVWDNLSNYLKNQKNVRECVQETLIWTANNYGYPKFQYHCDQCGDDVYTTTLKI